MFKMFKHKCKRAKKVIIKDGKNELWQDVCPECRKVLSQVTFNHNGEVIKNERFQ